MSLLTIKLVLRFIDIRVIVRGGSRGTNLSPEIFENKYKIMLKCEYSTISSNGFIPKKEKSPAIKLAEKWLVTFQFQN